MAQSQVRWLEGAVIKILDAGWGRQGFFTLIDDDGAMFIHYNKQPEGYAVFKMKGMNETKAQAVNRYLGDVIARGEIIFTQGAVGDNHAKD